MLRDKFLLFLEAFRLRLAYLFDSQRDPGRPIAPPSPSPLITTLRISFCLVVRLNQEVLAPKQLTIQQGGTSA